MDAALVLAGVGGVSLLTAGIARLLFASAKSSSNYSKPAANKIAPTAAQGAQTNGAAMSQAEEANTEEANTEEANTEEANTDTIEWQESADVYAPTEIVAAEFVPTLGLTRPPAILPQQSYIFVQRAALDKVQAHLRGNLEVEQGGLLLGQAFYDAGLRTYLLLVRDSLLAPDGIETPTFFGYTSASWRTLTPQLQKLPPDWTVIGSYHSHPNMGVFLSQTDLDTQEDIFCADWQIALVIDPVKDEIGFFVGKDGQECAEWYLLSAQA